MTTTDDEPKIFSGLQNLGSGIGAKLYDWHGGIRELGLESYVHQLDTYGYTVIPPEIVGAGEEQLNAIREAVLRVAGERTGVPHSLDENGSCGGLVSPSPDASQFLLFYLLLEDRVFEDWLENPILRALVRATMRGAAQLSSMVSFVKWRGQAYGEGLGLHSDAPASPEGVLPSTFDAVVNGVLVLTDYTHDDGALAVVPGSHLFARQPRPGEGVAEAIPVECPAGSLIFWHGNTWHGAFPKTTDGLRLNLTTYFCHRSFKTQENYAHHVPEQLLDRHDAEYARLLGADEMYGWGPAGPDYVRIMKYADLGA